MSDYLADELVGELILWRLPVNSIIECRLVCKSWYSLITSSHFISTHLLRCKNNPQICVFHCDYESNPGIWKLFFENQNKNENYSRSLSFRVPDLPYRPIIVAIGCVNGLICLSISETTDGGVVNFMVFNPSIGHFISIPPVPSSCGRTIPSYHVMGFGFDERTMDPIILAVFPDYAGFIYSLNSRCWRRITCCFPMRNWKMEDRWTIFVNGRFYWLAIDQDQDWFVMVFDIKSEGFGRISLPESVANSRCNIVSIMEFGESSSIAVLHRTDMNHHLWMLKDGSESSSWIKLTLATISPGTTVLGFRNKDQVLIKYPFGRIVSQKINNNDEEGEEVKNIVYADSILSVHKYVPSLVSLDKKNNVDVPAPTHAIRSPFDAVPRRRLRFLTKRIKTSLTF